MSSTRFSRATSSGVFVSGTGSSPSTRRRTGELRENEGAKMEKGGGSRPLFYCGRGRLTVSCRPSSSRPWLSSPLCSIPPFIWVSRVASSVAAAWHAHAIATARVLHSGHKEWLQQAILIPDVDYGCVICDVKHKVLTKVKKYRS